MKKFYEVKYAWLICLKNRRPLTGYFQRLLFYQVIISDFQIITENLKQMHLILCLLVRLMLRRSTEWVTVDTLLPLTVLILLSGFKTYQVDEFLNLRKYFHLFYFCFVCSFTHLHKYSSVFVFWSFSSIFEMDLYEQFRALRHLRHASLCHFSILRHYSYLRHCSPCYPQQHFKTSVARQTRNTSTTFCWRYFLYRIPLV